MPLVKVDVSKKQLSRLRNGHSVRVKSSKKTMEGKGFCLIVDPQKLNTVTVTRAFGKRKGAQIKIRTILEPREILANHQQLDIPTDEPVKIKMEGKGIFDDFAPDVVLDDVTDCQRERVPIVPTANTTNSRAGRVVSLGIRQIQTLSGNGEGQ